MDSPNFPATHDVHATGPAAALNVPAVQAVKLPPSGPVNPIEALQAVPAAEALTLPVPELLGHVVHAAAPVAALK